jgi:hypothetical protein
MNCSSRQNSQLYIEAGELVFSWAQRRGKTTTPRCCRGCCIRPASWPGAGLCPLVAPGRLSPSVRPAVRPKEPVMVGPPARNRRTHAEIYASRAPTGTRGRGNEQSWEFGQVECERAGFHWVTHQDGVDCGAAALAQGVVSRRAHHRLEVVSQKTVREFLRNTMRGGTPPSPDQTLQGRHRSLCKRVIIIDHGTIFFDGC